MAARSGTARLRLRFSVFFVLAPFLLHKVRVRFDCGATALLEMWRAVGALVFLAVVAAGQGASIAACRELNPDITSQTYCECVVGRGDNFVCAWGGARRRGRVPSNACPRSRAGRRVAARAGNYDCSCSAKRAVSLERAASHPAVPQMRWGRSARAPAAM